MRIAIIAVSLFLLSGMTSCGQYPQQRELSAFEIAVPDRYFGSNSEIDLFADRVAKQLVNAGFEKGPNHLTSSWGLAPLTRHTRHISMNLQGNNGVAVYASLSRCCISINFTEMETGIGTKAFSAASEEKQFVLGASITVKRFIEANLSNLDEK